MKILIVGGTSALAQALRPVLSGFAEVVTAGRKECDIYLNLDAPVENITIPPFVDVVVNAAAAFGGKSFQEIYQAETVNVLGALKLCQACLQAQVKHLVQISSASALLDKTSSYYGAYSLSKKHADEILEWYCTSVNLNWTILRPSQLYGNEDAFRKHQPFVYTAIDKAGKGEDVLIYGSRDAIRNYLHVEDFAQIIRRVIEQRVVGVYSCINGKDVSLVQIANSALEAFKAGGKVSFLTDKEDIPDNFFKHDDTLYEIIGYFPQIGIADGMKKIVAYQQLNL